MMQFIIPVSCVCVSVQYVSDMYFCYFGGGEDSGFVLLGPAVIATLEIVEEQYRQ